VSNFNNTFLNPQSVLLTFRVLHGNAPPYLGPLVPVRSLPAADASFVPHYRHQSSSGIYSLWHTSRLNRPSWLRLTGQAINRRYPSFPGCLPDLERPAGRCNIFPCSRSEILNTPFAACSSHSKRAFQEVFSDTAQFGNRPVFGTISLDFVPDF